MARMIAIQIILQNKYENQIIPADKSFPRLIQKYQGNTYKQDVIQAVSRNWLFDCYLCLFSCSPIVHFAKKGLC